MAASRTHKRPCAGCNLKTQMTPDRWKKVKALFDQAVDRNPSERQPFLDEACAGDPDLRDEVVTLLAAQEEVGARWDMPIVPPGALDPIIGRHVGTYRILRRLGTGGMGAVYLASRDDAQFRRLAAVKLIRPELLDDHTRRRFDNERNTLAALEHPNIVKLLDGGTTEDGWPYLMMDYVEGQPIDQFVSSRSLTIRERLELFRTLCGAVHYAHQNLVVHRDLKPANILVTPQGMPKLLDFGIAKLLRPAYAAATVGYTRTNAQPMTPEYASPEQILGQPITTASDVYSLGVLLYVLLTGAHPYRGDSSQSLHELERSICDGNPKKPSQAAPPALARELRGDLETIILTAMRKEPQRRYGSADQLAEDVRRYLAGEPLRARPDTLLYRTQKFVGRNRLATGLSAAAIVLLIGLGVQDRIDRLSAERRFQELRSFANFVIQDLDKAMADGPTPARKALSTKAITYLDGLAPEARGDTSLKLDLINGYLKVAEIQGNLFAANLGEVASARESASKALAIADTLTAKDLEDPAARGAAARSQEAMGNLLGPEGDRTAALEHYRKAISMLKGDPRGTLFVLGKVAQMQADGGDPAAALESYRQCERTAQEGAAKNPEDPQWRGALAFARERMAWFAMLAGQPAGAEEAIRAAIATYEVAKPTPRGRRNLAMAYKTMAEVEKRAGKTEDAVNWVRRSLAISQALSAADPKNSQYSIDIAQEKVLLIDLLLADGKKEEARTETAATLAWLRPLVHSDKPSLIYLADYVALLDDTPFKELAQGEDAVALARQAVEMTGRKDSETLDLLARALQRSGNFKEAAEAEQQALALLPPAQTGRPVPETRQKLQSTLAAIQTASANSGREGKQPAH